MSFLNGKKTYIIVGLYLLCLAAEKALGFDIPGFDAGEDWVGTTLAVLGLGTLRAGVKADLKI